MYLESPLNKRLNDLCDSETNSECSDKKLNPRMKLNFDNDSDSDYGDCPNLNNVKKTSKYFEKISVDLNEATPEGASNKENLDEFSSSGESLEERIRKKN
ncbi:hypothetical protein NQ314_011633 [Rhamnusium bicolor]|uniref:Uncharacterized protein n=1 Tax=Rhamnusium bicolor TaxID=1586634 RepID=A0AAV8XHM0_9CUCU|nr:hypothetical protein NQ314_011633 [Rhamnusium bicolor]